MRRIPLMLVIVLVVVGSSVHAQVGPTRFKKQHLKSTEEMLVKALEGKSPGMVASAAQTVRELEWEFPDESFSGLVIPLMRIVRDESAAEEARILAVLALDGLHSDTGDAAIKTVAGSSSSKTMQELCKALLVKGER